MSRNNVELGAAGERAALAEYEQLGYQLVEQNWRCEHGELDLIVSDGSELVFVEVKTRSSARFGIGAEAVDQRKQRQVRKLAGIYLASRRSRRLSLRFDVASVDASMSTMAVTILESAF